MTKVKMIGGALIGAAVVGIGCGLIYRNGLDTGKRFGIQQILQVAEEMQLGLAEALKTYVKEHY